MTTNKNLLLSFWACFDDLKNLQTKDIINHLPKLVIEIEKMSKLKRLDGKNKYLLLESILNQTVDKFVTNEQLKKALQQFISNDLSHIVSSIVFIAHNSKVFKRSCFNHKK